MNELLRKLAAEMTGDSSTKVNVTGNDDSAPIEEKDKSEDTDDVPENPKDKKPETPKDKVQDEKAEQDTGATADLSVVMDFLQDNPNPTDDQLHDWADQNGLNIHLVEQHMYFLATKLVNLMRGGMMNDASFDIDSVDPSELEMGIEIEMIHTPDPSVAKKLAMDNLSQIPDYYSRLQEMLGGTMEEMNAAAVPMEDGEIEETEPDDNGQEDEGQNREGASDAEQKGTESQGNQPEKRS
jgi:hypothetical protein